MINRLKTFDGVALLVCAVAMFGGAFMTYAAAKDLNIIGALCLAVMTLVWATIGTRFLSHLMTISVTEDHMVWRRKVLARKGQG